MLNASTNEYLNQPRKYVQDMDELSYVGAGLHHSLNKIAN